MPDAALGTVAGVTAPSPSSTVAARQHREQRDEQIQLADLQLRFSRFRARNLARERAVRESMARSGQRTPVLIAGLHGQAVLVDGFKRFNAARDLEYDALRARRVDTDEVGALALIATAQETTRLCPVEEGLLFWALQVDHTRSIAEIAELLERDRSLVQRRIALVRDFSDAVLDLVREGRISPSSLRALFPVAREDAHAAGTLAQACVDGGLTYREAVRVAQLYLAAPGSELRARILADPRATLGLDQRRRASPQDPRFSPEINAVVAGFGTLARQARSAAAALRAPQLHPLPDPARQHLKAQWLAARSQLDLLVEAAQEVLT